MPTPTAWQKSAHCGDGESCLHIAAHPGSVHLTESSDPTGAVLHATPTTWAALARTLQETGPHG